MKKHLRRLGFIFCLGLLFLSFFTLGGNNAYYDYESGAGYSKGQALPGASSENWSTQSIPFGLSLVLPDDYFIPTETYPAYNQTHLIISEGTLQSYNDPEAGVWF